MNVEEIKHQLFETYKYKIELHAHTNPASGCSDIPADELAGIYREKGFDAVVVTNHFISSPGMAADPERAVAEYVADYTAARAAGEKCGIRMILGAEIRFDGSGNDYLLYGVDPELLVTCCGYLPKGLAAFRRELELPRSLLIQAHPFRNGCEPSDAELLDGVESFNMHPNHNSRVALAAVYAQKNRLLQSVGTDFHHMGHQGLSAIRTRELPLDSFHMAEMLRSRDYVFEIGEGSIVLP